MKIQLSQQAAELLGKSELVIITEQVDDVALTSSLFPIRHSKTPKA